MNLVASFMMLFSVLMPGKLWYAPDQAVQVTIDSKVPVHLTLVDFSGKRFAPKDSAAAAPGQIVDVKAMFPQIGESGSYILFAVPADKQLPDFVGTPLVLQARISPRFAGPISTNVIKVSPLVYAKVETDQGAMKFIFWYDAAPNTVASFVSLAQGGFFDGLTFHRIVPGFVIQGGDPTGSGYGGPGYNVGAEFNDRLHDEGVLSMARTGDPLEAKGVMPRPEFANSAGSQFFICLSREKTQALDRKYTAFGRVCQGMDAVKKIAGVPLADPASGRPRTLQVIRKIQVVPVSATDNPYAQTLKLDVAEAGLPPSTTAPATLPLQ